MLFLRSMVNRFTRATTPVCLCAMTIFVLCQSYVCILHANFEPVTFSGPPLSHEPARTAAACIIQVRGALSHYCSTF